MTREHIRPLVEGWRARAKQTPADAALATAADELEALANANWQQHLMVPPPALKQKRTKAK